VVVRFYRIPRRIERRKNQAQLVRLQHSVLKKLARVHCLSVAILALANAYTQSLSRSC